MATDEELVQEVLPGRRESFGEPVHKYQGMVFGLAYHLLRHAADAQDAAQEVFIVPTRNWTSFTSRKSSPPGCKGSPSMRVGSGDGIGGT